MTTIRFTLLSAFFFILCIPLSMGQGLQTDPETNKITYQETVVLDSVTKEDIYERAKEWMATYFKTNKFDVNDKANFKLGHEGNFPVTYTYDFKYKSNNTVTFNFTLDQKEGKYRYTLTDFKIYDDKIGAKASQPLEVYYQKMKTGSKPEFTTNFTKEVNNLIEDMKKFMATGKEEEKDDW